MQTIVHHFWTSPTRIRVITNSTILLYCWLISCKKLINDWINQLPHDLLSYLTEFCLIITMMFESKTGILTWYVMYFFIEFFLFSKIDLEKVQTPYSNWTIILIFKSWNHELLCTYLCIANSYVHNQHLKDHLLLSLIYYYYLCCFIYMEMYNFLIQERFFI